METGTFIQIIIFFAVLFGVAGYVIYDVSKDIKSNR